MNAYLLRLRDWYVYNIAGLTETIARRTEQVERLTAQKAECERKLAEIERELNHTREDDAKLTRN